jgi:uncharacterized protein
MFPLGTVLFPHMVLPLHVFEPRYRALLDDVLEGGGEFGVVLISRGHEVGGGDLRTDVGTVARILRAEQLDEDRWFVIAVGTRASASRAGCPTLPTPVPRWCSSTTTPSTSTRRRRRGRPRRGWPRRGRRR